MLENTTIARPYAVAAFNQAREDNALSDWSGALGFLAAVVADQNMRRVIFDPRVDKPRLTQLVLDIGGARFPPLVGNFIALLVENERLHLAPEMSRLFDQRRADAEGTVAIEIVTAYELNTNERQRLANAVAQRLDKQVEVATRVDNTLIGGAVVRVGDLVFDASLRGRLEQLENTLVQ